MRKVILFLVFLGGSLYSFGQNYNRPGVYIEEIATLPPAVAQVETAVPAFIGFTEKGPVRQPVRISSMADFEATFGSFHPASFNVRISTGLTTNSGSISKISRTSADHFYLFYSLLHYFDNGGGSCYVLSLGAFADRTTGSGETAFKNALDVIKNEDEPTLLVFPDALFLSHAKYYAVVNHALAQCALLKDRFTIIDIHPGSNSTLADIENELKTGQNFRNAVLTSEYLKFGAAYTPYLNTSYAYRFHDSHVTISGITGDKKRITKIPAKNKAIALNNPDFIETHAGLHRKIKTQLAGEMVTLPPSAAMAGIYARVDRERGVWKAPANVSVLSVTGPSVSINDSDQDGLNIDPASGRSINAIRSFSGRGTLVWGSRTLAGNDNEWRYVPVRRLFNTVEESIRKSTAFVVFEPNDANTWLNVKAMAENYLMGLWRQGALAGSKAESAFFVKVGLGETMTAQDIVDGYMIVEIGMAVVRPAEFIIFRVSHKLN